MRVEYIPLSKIKGYPKNPKEHDLGALKESISSHGFFMPVMLDERANHLLAGHGRIQLLMQMKAGGGKPPKGISAGPHGEWMVPALRGVSLKNPPKYVIADNRVSEIGGWHTKLLAEVLKYLKQEDALQGTGYNEEDLDEVLKGLNAQLEAGVTVAEKMKRYQAGEQLQIVLYFSREEYQRVLLRMKAIQRREKLETTSDVFKAVIGL